jgi:plasmid stability protein
VSKSITVWDVPDDVCTELAARAAVSGRSLQEYLRSHLVDLARSPEAEGWVARVHARKAATASTLDAATILSHKDADRL